ncbi:MULTISPECIES: 16S rRNA (uracil(1498)-N(3))-methyltransferase [unclassified Rothia (in: high G+C Gram-positive bacteria)]|uniref:16S rRNA (uracil(1498)-N(3))-methyltransferase n=1 Tax=unclassified Rothia (in: high G+C Gram-positive bacteria) TaxID=2689056 RepID=UPI00195E60C3|nr:MULTISPECIES: 16S rRNA (uracil(1498)-N(3))-methyltransferase [unclassified Rothia (in: high G+C Gram-positive bacteria)]MBM7050527.1 16S rRNA (uracil(1498)-N(3))-methyltransferase [Rothia sp. ZJ1223]QRZ60721.1 16S rRNA (uracil(1498)-N(3))-methyltransferase [Rothia sp. ZJ932]
MTAPIFYPDDLDVGELAVGDTVTLTGDEGHHAKNVKRLSVGEAIDIADGCGTRLVGEVAQVIPEGLAVRIRAITQEAKATGIYLVQALAKNDRDLMAIEMATELGAVGIVPWSADRSIVRWKGERASKSYAKWQKTVQAAAKQSRRALIPTVYDLHSSKQLAQMVAEVTSEGAAVFILHEQGNQRLTDHLRVLDVAQVPEVYVVVGPEGGISDAEVDALVAAGASVGLLGTEVLRSSTAGAAALSALNLWSKAW